MQAKVLGIGNALVDVLVRIPSDSLLDELGLPRGSMQLVDPDRATDIYNRVQSLSLSEVSGGSVPNMLCGLANLGVQAGFLGKIGNDRGGEVFMKDLEKAGIEQHMLFSDSMTGNCISLISTDSERTMATCLGAASELTTADINPSLFTDYTHFYTEGYLVQDAKLIESILSMAHSKGLTVCFDLASYNVVEDNQELMQKLISKYVDVVFANEEEATAFTGKEDVEALNGLGELCNIVVLKQGSRGSLVKCYDKVVRTGVVLVDCIDTTGAGDLFAAGFIFGMINGFNPEDCAIAGSITSGNVIEVIGTKMDTRRWNKVRLEMKRLMHSK